MKNNEDVDTVTLQRARRGNEAAYRALYSQYKQYVWALAWRMSDGDRETAAEIMQRGFIAAFKALRTYKGTSAFSTWLYRIVYNAALDFIRTRRRIADRERVFDERIAAAAGGDATENRDFVKKILTGLSPTERFVLTGREVTGLSYEELAVVTGKEEGALRTMVHRIKERIRAHWQTEYAYGG